MEGHSYPRITWTQTSFLDRERTSEQRVRFTEAPEFPVGLGEVVVNVSSENMRRLERAIEYGAGAVVESQRLRIPPLAPVKRSQIIQARCEVRMIRPVALLLNSEAAPHELLGLQVTFLIVVHHAKSREVPALRQIVRLRRALIDCDGLLVKCLGIVRASVPV